MNNKRTDYCPDFVRIFKTPPTPDELEKSREEELKKAEETNDSDKPISTDQNVGQS